MSLTLATPARNASVDGRTALANSGKLKIRAGSTVLATFTLPATAFNAASAGSATARGGDGTNPIGAGNPLSVNAGAAGTADNYQVTTGADVLLWDGSVGQGSGDLSLDNTNIANGQAVKVTAWTHSQPAS